MSRTMTARKYVYGLAFFFLILSGFGHMPLYKRYYVADIPGLAWLADFYITFIIHYVAAAVLIALVVYIIFDFFLGTGKMLWFTGSGFFKGLLIAGLIISGSLLVYKNLPGTPFSHEFIIGLYLVHLAFCVILLMLSLYTLIRRKPWVRP